MNRVMLLTSHFVVSLCGNVSRRARPARNRKEIWLVATRLAIGSLSEFRDFGLFSIVAGGRLVRREVELHRKCYQMNNVTKISEDLETKVWLPSPVPPSVCFIEPAPQITLLYWFTLMSLFYSFPWRMHLN